MTLKGEGHEPLKNEFNYYLEHQAEFVKKYDGKVIALKDHTLLGAYESYGDAYMQTKRRHEPGTFMLQRVSEGEEDYTVTIHSPVFPP